MRWSANFFLSIKSKIIFLLSAAPSNLNLSTYLSTWQTFLEQNRKFIEHFDFIRDLAVEDPGDSPVIMAK